MAKQRTALERQQEVDAWRRSGESLPRYAARRGYAATTLRMWVRQERPDPGPALMRLMVAPSAAVPAEREVVVEVGAARIRVRNAFDAKLLKAVVAALSAEASS